MTEKPKVICIVGPTASGKTGLAVEIAKLTGGEIISADSMQVYKDMPIASAAPTNEEKQGVKHYLLEYADPGEQQTLALTLKPLPARLTVVSSPEQARVFLDNDYQGKTPVNMSAAPGRHELRVELAGHAPVTRSVTLANGAEATEEFNLASVLGRLEVITTPPGAKISIDGKAVGTTKAQGEAPRSQILPLENINAGEHSVMAHLDGYQDVSRRVTVKANDTSKLFIKLPRVFTPDTEVITTWNRDGIRGVLVNKDYLGNITIETSPGISTTIKAEDIRSVQPLMK